MDSYVWLLKLLCLIPVILPVSQFGILFAMFYALDQMRVDASAGNVKLVGPDAWSMMCCLIGGVLLTAALALSVDLIAPFIVASVSLLAACGCRVELVVNPNGSRLSRRIFGVSWRVWRSESGATLFVDGWGDLLDPEALFVEFDMAHSLELAWCSANSGSRADEFAAEFNSEVRHLHEEALRGAVGGAPYRSRR